MAAPAGSLVGPDTGRQPHLDGLRALAVYLVVAFHAGLRPLSGGFVGVDAFFVLSGFLITGLLLDEWRRDGRVVLRRFYARRLRRLMPAAAVCVVGTLVLLAHVSTPIEREAMIPSARAGTWFFANWHFIDQARDYFAVEVQSSPFLHWWSLSVEEQFYFVWPLLLLGVFTVARRRARPLVTISVLLGVAAVVATAWTLVAAHHDALRAYYATDTRAFGLIGGAALAVVTRSARWPRLGGRATDALATAGLGGLLVLSTRFVTLAPLSRAVLASGCTLVLIAALHSSQRSVVRPLLGWRPLAYLGTISYATYLWHWPLILVVRQIADVRPGELAVVVALLASGVAALSSELVERPVRRSSRLDHAPYAVIAAGAAVVVLVGAVVVPAIGRRPASTVLTTSPAAPVVPLMDTRTPVPPGLREPVLWRPDGIRDRAACLERSAAPDPATCTAVTGRGPRVMLVGDSTAEVFIDAFAAIAQEQDWSLTLATHVSCLWQLQLGLSGTGDDAFNPRCAAVQEQVFGPILDDAKPDIVVVMNLGRLDKGAHLGLDATLAGHQGADLFEVATRRSVTRLLEVADHVVLVEPIPSVAITDKNCLAQATYVEECARLAQIDYTTAALYRRLAAEDARVATVDFADVVCPANPVCDAVLGGMPAWYDGGHPNATWIESQRAEILSVLLATSAFSRRAG